jgi:hypothetical protein
MRRASVAAFAVAMGLVVALPATAATPSPAQLAGQVRALQKQVTTLRKQVKTINKTLLQVETVAIVSFLYGGCNSAATADALQGGNPAMFGSTQVNDYNACTDLGKITNTTITRAPNTPTVNVFQQLLNLFKPA